MGNSRAIDDYEDCYFINPEDDTGLFYVIKGGTYIAPYIKAKEVACQSLKDGERGVISLSSGFLGKLNALRVGVCRPFTYNSVCRTIIHNTDISGHESSLHLIVNAKHGFKGSLACDLSVNGWTPEEIEQLLEIAWQEEWSIGTSYVLDDEGRGSGFIHLDRRVDIGLKQHRWNY